MGDDDKDDNDGRYQSDDNSSGLPLNTNLLMASTGRFFIISHACSHLSSGAFLMLMELVD